LQVNEVHRQFVIALQELFEENKAKAGYPSLHLQNHVTRFQVVLALDQMRISIFSPFEQTHFSFTFRWFGRPF
jgi:hypothetical protein